MSISRAPLVMVAIMAILFVGFAVFDVQGNAETEFTLRGIKGNKPTTSGEYSLAKYSEMKKEGGFITDLQRERKLSVTTDGTNTDTDTSHHHEGAAEYCRFLKSIGKSCP